MATTAFAKKTSYLQKVGHGSLCEGLDHRGLFAVLCGRPYGMLKTCPLGRETGISEVVWKEDWPYLLSGTQVPDAEFNGYGELQEIKEIDYDFTSAEFRGDFQSLRVPAKYEIVGKTLRLYGNEVPSSAHEQSLLARRQDSADFEAETVVDFAPTCYRQLAGLTYRYNEDNQYYLRISWDENKNERVVGVLAWDKGRFSRTPDEKEISVGKSGKVWLKVSVKGEDAVFSCSTDGVNYKTLPGVYCATKLSDEYATPMGFMGAFVGMMATDFERKTSYADFLSFKYTRK
jgi:xylan 1,4-beta-xylosidase